MPIQKSAVIFLAALFVTFHLPLLAHPEKDEVDRGSWKEKCRTCQIKFTTQDELDAFDLDVKEDSLIVQTLVKVHKNPFQTDSYSPVRRAIPFDMVSSIKCGDPIHDGAIKGFLIGALPGLFIGGIYSAIVAPDGDPEFRTGYDASKAVGLGFAIGGMIGAVMGLFIDNSHGSRPEDIDIDELKKEWMENRVKE